jgi:uncharacterized protein (TIGR03437 family)
VRFFLLFLPALACAAPAVKVSPAAVAFTMQEGAATLPAPQSISVTAITASQVVNIQLNTGGSPWLTVSPSTGRTTLAVRVAVNPTGLPVGQYTEQITVTTPGTTSDAVVVPVSLTVRAAPPDVRVTPSPINITYRIGDSPPSAQTLQLAATGGLVSYTVTVSGAKWLRAAPLTGAVFPGFPAPIALTPDMTDLAPGSYKGSVAIATPAAVTKTSTIAVNLTVQPGVPTVSGLWPPSLVRGSPESTITVRGGRFFTGTTVRSGSTTLRTTILGPNALTAVVPASMLAAEGDVPITVSNPDPGGGSASAVNLHVVAPGPIPLAVVHGATQQMSALAPGALMILYGSGMGPESLAIFDSSLTAVPTALSGTRVLVNNQPAPIIYTSSRQIGFAAPNGLAPDVPVTVQVEYGGATSSAVNMVSAPASPGLYTLNGTGLGQAVAFHTDPAKNDLVLNTESSPASKGFLMTFYATGAGVTSPPPSDGAIATGASSTNFPGVAFLLGDVAAEILYAGAAPGLITGILQINVRLPDNVPVGKNVPVTLRIGSYSSPVGTTVSIK